jgi:HEAT repeat protein
MLDRVIRDVDTGQPLTNEQKADIEALVHGLATDASDPAWESALGQVQQMGQAAVPHLIHRLRSERDFWRRGSALCAIFLIAQHARKTKGEAAEWVEALRPLWLAMCRDPHPSLREFSAGKLRSLHRRTAVADLARVLKEETDPAVQRTIGRMLMGMGHKELVPSEVIKAVEDSGWSY